MKKAKVNKELWLFNTSSSDVSVSDLGVKVLAGESVNVYDTNPYLTEEQVDKSMKYGALLKRLGGENPVLKMVKKKVSAEKTKIHKIAQSKEPIKATKRNSTIVIEQKTVDEIVDDDKGFDFADYGVDPTVSAPTRDGVGVVIKAKEDPPEVVVAEKDLSGTKEKQTNPMGKMSEVVVPTNSFAVVKTEDVPNVEKTIDVSTALKEVRGDPRKITRFDPDSKESAEKSIKYDDSVRKETVVKPAIPEKSEDLVVVKTDCAVVVENKTELESKTKEEGGMRVASRTKNGITVMKIKE